jgi:hypothetical protein
VGAEEVGLPWSKFGSELNLQFQFFSENNFSLKVRKHAQLSLKVILVAGLVFF